MRKPKINITVLKEGKGFSAFTSIRGDFIGTQGYTFNELKINILEAVNLSFEDKGLNYDIEDVHLTLDLASFFEYYKVINAKALSQRLGVNKMLLAQYISGHKKPSPSQTKRIMQGVNKIGRELSE